LPLPDETQVIDAIRPVIDPELGLSIVDLGLVYGVTISPEGAVTVRFTATTAGCPIVEVIAYGIFQSVRRLPGVTAVTPVLVWDPPWTPEKITPEGLRHLQARKEH
jgi:metal-sulfur cluster biosynthetic enzyme